MSGPKYRVMLTEEETEHLESLLRKGKSAARKQTRARTLLKSAQGRTVAEIAAALAISADMIGKARRRCVDEGVEAALKDRPHPGNKPKLSDRQCAHIIATAYNYPGGHDHWTLRLLVDKVVELEYAAETFCREAVRQLLKKHIKTVAAAGMVYTGSQWCTFCRNGRCTGF